MSIEGHGHLHMESKTDFSQKPLGHFDQTLYADFHEHEEENLFT